MTVYLIKILFCYSRKNFIEFRDLNNLDEILYTHSVARNKPGRLFPVSPSILLFGCGTVEGPEIHWLDCSAIPPKEVSQKNVIFPTENIIWEMCFVNEEKNRKRLIIITAGNERIYAYNVDTKSLEWKTEIKGMKQVGIVSDSHGHLFICDLENKCIHMISVSDGQYMGCLIERGDQGMGSPVWGVWSEETSSLIVAHRRDFKWFISVIKIQ